MIAEVTPMDPTNTTYRFAVLADIHIDLENGGKNIYFIHAERNFARALEVITRRGCAFVISAGDQVTNASGAVQEWRRYNEIIRASGYPGTVFEAMGNHEIRFTYYGNCSITDCRREFVSLTRLHDKPILRPTDLRSTGDLTYYAYIDDRFGDAFVFLSLENGVNVNEIDDFSDEQMDWAEMMTERFLREKRRVFLIQHAPLLGSGVGDDADDPAYEGSIRLTDKDGRPFTNNRRFYDLFRRSPEIIWLSGHTHVDLRDEVNYRFDGCHMLHIPALAGSTRLIRRNDRRVLDRTFYGDAAQGYIAEVEKDRVTFKGIDFLCDRFYPEYEYTIYR